jgi:hypothetical protein
MTVRHQLHWSESATVALGWAPGLSGRSKDYRKDGVDWGHPQQLVCTANSSPSERADRMPSGAVLTASCSTIERRT